MSQAVVQALVLEAPHCLVVRERPLPEVGDDAALVRVAACGHRLREVPQRPLLPGQISREPGAATVLGQRCRRLTAGKQPESAHSSDITATNDVLQKGERGGVFRRPRAPGASTPQF
jgi:hypothetical protein